MKKITITFFLLLLGIISIICPISASMYPSRYFDSDTCITCSHSNTRLSDESLRERNQGIEASDWYIRGEELFEAGDYEGAILNMDHAIMIKPDHWMAWVYKGRALCHVDRCEEAVTATKKAIKIGNAYKPGEFNAVLWNDLGSSYYMLGRYEEALDAYDKAIELDPGSENMARYQKNRDMVQKLFDK
ncbi:MAG: tetratricopeptide repeat protein [Methanospirillaceae archaeon]|nr:tetratricopeptide repeat protein [Methanospirillaceae archaeon]